MEQSTRLLLLRSASAGLISIACCACVLFVAAQSARAVDSVVVGQAGNNSYNGPCPHCSAFQWSDSGGANSYRFPFNGVLTEFAVRTGTAPGPSEQVQLRAFRPTAANNATLVAQGSAQAIPVTSNVNVKFFERVSVSADDVLGARFNVVGASADYTEYQWDSASAADNVSLNIDETGFPLTLGFAHAFGIQSTNRRVNIQALLEPDADSDGYGDESQDLCISDASRDRAPCTGSLLGSGIKPGLGAGGGGTCFGNECILVQRSIRGAPSTAPFDGVIVRWRVRPHEDMTTRLRIVQKISLSEWKLQRSSPPVALDFSGTGNRKVFTFETRLPISAGEYLGIDKPAGKLIGTSMPDPGFSAVDYVLPGADGSVVGDSAEYLNQELAFSVDVEPDADHDGYGDLTQDTCPTDPGTQSACALPAPPSLSGLKMKHAKFRVKPRGKPLSAAKTPVGSTLGLTLSQNAGVRFVLSTKLQGKRAGSKCVKRTKKNAKKKACTYYRKVFGFNRSLTAGATSLAFSGRYKKGKKNASLSPGSYRIQATPTNASGGIGAVAATTFRIVKK